MNTDISHPGLKKVFELSMFTIHRTDHHLGRILVDLALEQTIGADASSLLNGKTSATNNYSARHHLMITKIVRTSFIGQVQEMVGLIKKDDCITELKLGRNRI